MKNKKGDYFYLGVFGSLFVASFVLILIWAASQMNFKMGDSSKVVEDNNSAERLSVYPNLKTQLVTTESNLQFAGKDFYPVLQADFKTGIAEPGQLNINLDVKQVDSSLADEKISGFEFFTKEVPAYLKFSEFKYSGILPTGWSCDKRIGGSNSQGIEISDMRIICNNGGGGNAITIGGSAITLGILKFTIPVDLKEGQLGVGGDVDNFSFEMSFSRGTEIPASFDAGFDDTIEIEPYYVDINSFQITENLNANPQDFIANWEILNNLNSASFIDMDISLEVTDLNAAEKMTVTLDESFGTISDKSLKSVTSVAGLSNSFLERETKYRFKLMACLVPDSSIDQKDACETKSVEVNAAQNLPWMVNIDQFLVQESSNSSTGMESFVAGDPLSFTWKIKLSNMGEDEIGKVVVYKLDQNTGRFVVVYIETAAPYSFEKNAFTIVNSDGSSLVAEYPASVFKLKVEDLDGTVLASKTVELMVGENSQSTTDCSDLFKGLDDNKESFDITDLTELKNRLLNNSTGVDVNGDSLFNFADVIAGMQCFVCLWNWDRDECSGSSVN